MKCISFNASTFFISTFLVFYLSMPAIASYKQWPLQKQGEIRYLKIIKVYDVSLYSPTSLNADNVLNSNISKCLKLDYAVNLSVDKIRLATQKILQRQHDANFLASIKQPLAKLQSSYKSVKKGDIYNLCYNGKNKTMRLDLNDINLVEIKSAKFASAYLGIWLSKNKPISFSLYNSFFSNNNKG